MPTRIKSLYAVIGETRRERRGRPAASPCAMDRRIGSALIGWTRVHSEGQGEGRGPRRATASKSLSRTYSTSFSPSSLLLLAADPHVAVSRVLGGAAQLTYVRLRPSCEAHGPKCVASRSTRVLPPT